MKINLNVDVHHLARVEGHGNIKVRVEGGQLAEARWEVVETPRFFEVMLKGKDFAAAGILTARICGICSIGHCLASVRATEHAFGMEVPEAAAETATAWPSTGRRSRATFSISSSLPLPIFSGLQAQFPWRTSSPTCLPWRRDSKGWQTASATWWPDAPPIPSRFRSAAWPRCPTSTCCWS